MLSNVATGSNVYGKAYDTANSALYFFGKSIEKLPYGNLASGLRNPIVSLVQAVFGTLTGIKQVVETVKHFGGNGKLPWSGILTEEVSSFGWAAFNLIWAGSTRFEPLKKASDYLGHLGAALFGINMIFEEKTTYNVTKGLVDVTKMVALAGLLPKKVPAETAFHALSLLSFGMKVGHHFYTERADDSSGPKVSEL